MYVDWPPPFVAAPAGEIPIPVGRATPMMPSTSQLEWAHKALQVTFMGLALLGLFVILSSAGPRAVLRGAAKKHAVA